MKQITRKKPANLNWIQKQGLLAVKLAQIFALRPDIISEEKCQQLQQLYEHAKTIPEENVIELLNEVAPENFNQSISDLQMKPFASASIGQVHLAKVGEQKVAIKIIKAKHEKKFRRDIKRMRRWLKYFLFFSPKLRKVGNPMALLSHVEDYTLRELDLRNEIKGAKKLSTIQKNLDATFPMPLLKFPKYWPELSNEHILVSEFIEGETIGKQITEGKLPWDKMLELFRIHGAFMFGTGIFHGDLHPGNCILTKTGEFVFIDTGAICEAPKRVSNSLFNFFESLSLGKKTEAFSALLKISDAPTKPNVAAYMSEMEKIYSNFEEVSVGEQSLTRIMMKTVKVAVEKAGADFGEEGFPIIRSLMYMDGMAIRSNPNAKLIRSMQPYLEEFRIGLQIE